MGDEMDDDDDLYGGYTATASSFKPTANDDEFNHDAPPAASGSRQGTAGPGRMGTAALGARPMTASNKAAGYSGGREVAALTAWAVRLRQPSA